MAQHYNIDHLINDPEQPTWTKKVKDEILEMFEDENYEWENWEDRYDIHSDAGEFSMSKECFKNTRYLSKTMINDNTHKKNCKCEDCKYKFSAMGCIAVHVREEDDWYEVDPPCPNCKKAKEDLEANKIDWDEHDEILNEHHYVRRDVLAIFVVA